MSFDACAELVRKGDPERFLSVMAAPPRLRAALFAVYAFNVEVARAPWITAEPLIAEMRLQWWADVLDEIAGGGPVRRHEVATPLAEVLTADAVRDLAGLVAARRLDVAGAGVAGWDAAREHVRDSAGGLMAAAGAISGADRGFDALRAYGGAAGMAAFLIALPEMTARGRHIFDGHDDPDLIGRAARDAADDLRAARAALPRSGYPAARAAWLADARLRAIARDPELVRAGGPAISEFRRRGSLLLRAALNRP